VGTDPKSNNGSSSKRPRWADYEEFEDVDDFYDGVIQFRFSLGFLIVSIQLCV
jgi:hypothetical protein